MTRSSDPDSQASTPRVVSHYEILGKLGGGGMGIVYKARDNRLHRDVALKFLSPELSHNEAAKRRFLVEARAASRIDHANVCTVHEIDEDENGRIFIAMTYYDGETLEERIARGPLPLPEALDVAEQVAAGLGETHRHGIVHRDIKPGNLIVTRGGVVKIVDFGLVKLASGARLTGGRFIVGTVAYMSPEQSRGEQADERTDIWSLGVVLYEMVTGRLPFHSEVGEALIYSIRNDQPLLPEELPEDVIEVISKALEKSPSSRYPSAAHFLTDLRRVKARLSPADEGSGAPPTTLGPREAGATPARPLAPEETTRLRKAGSRNVWTLLGLASLTAAGVAFLLSSRPDDGVGPITGFTNPVQLTLAVGIEEYPSWSPDGRMIAYSATQSGDLFGGRWDIWVTAVDSGEPVNRTADSPRADRFPVWSPDGNRIAFWSDREGGGYYVMSSLGGKARRIASASLQDRGRPQWSPDGEKLAFVVTHAEEIFIEVLALGPRHTERLSLPGVRDRPIDITWSPDGRLFAFVEAPGPTADVSRLWILETSSGATRPVTEGQTNEWSPFWARDGRSLYYVSNRGGTMDLWRQRITAAGVSEGEPQALTTGLNIRQAAFSPDEKRLAYAQGRRVSHLWRVPLSAEPASWADAEQLTFDEAFIEHVDVSPDGRRLAISSNRAGNPDLWLLPAEGGDVVQLTTDPSSDWNPRWSPDGNWLAFYSYRSGNRDIWVMPSTGGVARQLTTDPATDAFPAWSPDGRRVAFYSLRGGNPDLWVVPVMGGDADRFTFDAEADYFPEFSPDGQELVFASSRTGESQLFRTSAHGGRPTPLTKGPAWYPRWSPDNDWIYFTGFAERAGNIWAVSPKTGEEKAVTNFETKRGMLGSFALATDARHLYFTWEEDLGDLWTMDVERK